MQICEAVRASLDGCSGDQRKAVAVLMGIAVPTLYQFADGQRRLHAEHIELLCAGTGNRAVLDVITIRTESAMRKARDHGQMEFDLPLTEIDLVREANDIPTTLLRGFADDGRLDGRERRDVWKEVNEFIRAFVKWSAGKVRRVMKSRAGSLAAAELRSVNRE